MKLKYFLLLLISVLCVNTLTGCSSSSQSGFDSKSLNNANSESVVLSDSIANQEDFQESDNNDGSEIQTNDLKNRKLIKTVDLTIETEKFEKVKNNLEKHIEKFGAYIESSQFNSNSYDTLRSYNLTVRVPTRNLDSFLSSVNDLGVLKNKSENVEDVTLNYVDIQAHKKSIEKEYNKILELLDEAKDLDTILKLESKLSDLRYKIDSYESQLRTYDNLIDYSTVNIYLNEVKKEEEKPETLWDRIRTGFMDNLTGVKEFFIDLFVLIVTSIPIIFVLVLIFFIFRFFKRKFHLTSTFKHKNKNQNK